MKQGLLIVGNQVPEDWEFRKGVETATGEKWNVRVCVINRFDGIRKYTRYLTFFLGPLQIFFRRNRYSKILSWEQFLALMIAFYCRLFHVRSCPPIYVMALIYKPKKGLIGRLFAWFVRYAVTSRYVKRIIVYSKSEVAYYSELFGVSEEKFFVEVLGIEDRPDLRCAGPDAREKYYLAPGRSNRDYDFLRSAWPEDGSTIYVVCDVETAEDAGRIRYLKNCHGDEYLRLLAGSYAVLVPLQSEKISSGQMVFLQSAMLGKPVITTWNETVGDYVEDGETGVVIEKTETALCRALEALDDPDRYQQMSRRAREVFLSRFSLFDMGKRVGARITGDLSE